MPELTLLEGIAARNSCRAFAPTPVPPEVLKSVLASAVRSPSARNSQPWEVYVLGGAKLDEMRARMIADFESGRTVPMRRGGEEPPARVARARALGEQLAPSLAAQGWETGGSFVVRSVRLFDAPAAAVVCVDDPAIPYAELDTGMFIQTLCLSALGHGLGTCVLGYPLIVEPTIREYLALPAARRVKVCVAIGYPADQPMAKFRSARSPLSENVRFLF